MEIFDKPPFWVVFYNSKHAQVVETTEFFLQVLAVAHSNLNRITYMKLLHVVQIGNAAVQCAMFRNM